MFADTAVRTVLHTARHDAVYAKTATGRAEVIQRRMGLSRRQRSVLILLDGQRSCAALAAMMPDGQVAEIVTALLALDLIAPCAAAEAVATAAARTLAPAPARAPTAVSATLAPASVAAPADAPDDDAAHAEGIAAIKAYMVQAAQTCLGLLAAEVVDRIERAHDAAGLRGVVGHWHMALQASKHGRATAAGHLGRVRTDLRRAGIEA